jgi:hypothetical protein
MSTGDMDKDPFIRFMRGELDKAVRDNVCEDLYAGDDPDQVSQKEIELECEKRKNTIMGILDKSVRMQRLYFVFRSIFMGLISAMLSFTVILYLGSIDVIDAIFLGIIVFIFSLLFSRLFDSQIISLCLKIIRLLNKNTRIRKIILRFI